MKLYLSSFGPGRNPERISGLMKGGARKAAVIVNAVDANPKVRAQVLKGQAHNLAALGFDVTELDLRNYFGQAEKTRAVLEKVDLLWVAGGNSFLLRRAMRASGLDSILPDLVTQETLVYGGFSAGVVVLSRASEGSILWTILMPPLRVMRRMSSGTGSA